LGLERPSWRTKQTNAGRRHRPSHEPQQAKLYYHLNRRITQYHNGYRKSGTTRTLSSYYNRLDVVPLAWNADGLLTISGLYNPPIDASALVPLVFLMSLAVRPTDYLQVCPDAKPLAGGSLKLTTLAPGKLPIVAFIDEQKYQHVGAYFDLLRIGPEAQRLRNTLE
jgi:hypothetical protein